MHFLRTKKLHIATLFLSVFIGGTAWMLVGPTVLRAYELPSNPGDDEIDPETGRAFNNPEILPGAADKPTDLRYDPSGVFAPATAGGAPGAQTEAERQKSAATAAANALKQDQTDQMTCFGGMTGLSFSFNGCVAQVMNFAMWLSARTLWIAGVLLNMTLDYTLNLNNLLERLPVVDIGWKVLRDLSNIVFIFVALWCGLSITLGIGDNGKKAWGLLAQMVLVALFINFSLFITKAVVDVSNVAALHFYSLIVEPGNEHDYDSGLSESFLYGLKLSTLYNTNDRKQSGLGADNMLQSANASGGGQALSFTNIILIGAFGSLFIIVTAWVFFAAAIMFIYRAITLIMLMMLSPLAFVGLILPGASSMAHQWWSKLWSQAFFAPLYLALAYIVVKTISSKAFQDGLIIGSVQGDKATGFAAAITGTAYGNVAVIFNFVILIGLMVGCLVVAESLGAKGSDMAMAGWEKIKGTTLGGIKTVSGAGVRGIIKAPAGAARGVGGALSGQSGLGKWMASTKLLNNKLFSVKKMQESEFGKTSGKVGSALGKATDVRFWEERAGQSWLGQTTVGKAVRAVTTGAIANVKIGDESLEEAHKRGEEQETARKNIGYITEARRAGNDLEPMWHDQNHLQDEKEKAQESEDKAKEAVEGAKSGLTPEQQKTVREKEKALAEAKAGTPGYQEEVKKKREEVEKSEKLLGQAEASEKLNPTAENTRKKEEAKLQLDAKNKELADAEKIQPDHADKIKAAEDELKTAKTAGLTQKQKDDRKLAEDAVAKAKTELETAKAQKPDPADLKNVDDKQKNLEKVRKDIEAMEKELEAAKTSGDLVKMANAPALEEKIKKAKEDPNGSLQKAQKELGDAQRGIESRKKLQETDVATAQTKLPAAEKDLETAKGPTPEQQEEERKWKVYQEAQKDADAHPNDPALQRKAEDAKKNLNKQYTELANASENLAKAAKALQEFKDKNGKKMADLVTKRSHALAQMSAHEFIKYAPKEDKKRLDFESDPPGHFLAVMEDEHMTEGEKEEATHHYVHRLMQEARRGEKRNERFAEMMIDFQKKFGKNMKMMEQFKKEAGLSGFGEQLRKVEKLIEEAEERKAERKKKKKDE